MMNTQSVHSVPLADIRQVRALGLDLNRLLFIKYLILTRRIGEQGKGSQPSWMATPQPTR